MQCGFIPVTYVLTVLQVIDVFIYAFCSAHMQGIVQKMKDQNIQLFSAKTKVPKLQDRVKDSKVLEKFKNYVFSQPDV